MPTTFRTVCGVRVPRDSPTVSLSIEVPSEDGCGYSGWCPMDGTEWNAEAFVYSASELDAVCRSFALAAARVLAKTSSIPRFRVVVRGLFTGRLVSMADWVWNPYAGAYGYATEPVNLWDALEEYARLYPPVMSAEGLSRLASAHVSKAA